MLLYPDHHMDGFVARVDSGDCRGALVIRLAEEAGRVLPFAFMRQGRAWPCADAGAACHMIWHAYRRCWNHGFKMYLMSYSFITHTQTHM